jgi:ABC-2 type transport system ATP-binding protein
MSTHTLKVAEDICDRIGIIHKGSLVAMGTAEDLKRDILNKEADHEEIFIELTRE